MADVTQVLKAIESGDPKAASKGLPMVYDEFRRLADLDPANRGEACGVV